MLSCSLMGQRWKIARYGHRAADSWRMKVVVCLTNANSARLNARTKVERVEPLDLIRPDSVDVLTSDGSDSS